MLLACSSGLSATQLALQLPLGRTAYQCNEYIDLTVLAGEVTRERRPLTVTLSGEQTGKLRFVFGDQESLQRDTRVRHLRINGQLLRPGTYRLEASISGASAGTNITLHSPVRKTTFKLVNWGRAKAGEQAAQGEENLGFNIYYGGYARDEEANLIRGGVDFIPNCVMSGGHQMDLRPECDWSDPYVIRGGTRRVVRRAFIDRTRPNVPGIHFFDEPGLTWGKDPDDGAWTPHRVPWQWRSYEAAYGTPPPDWKSLDGSDPGERARWTHWARWKLGLIDAAWQDAKWGVQMVVPGALPVTQSQYGWTAFTDGYYFNVVRSLPVISGHGGYHDFGPGYFNPSFFLEFARAHDLRRPNWYLPVWYGQTTADEYRLEQYLCFQCNLQGIICPPDLEPGIAPAKSRAAQGIVECNHLLARLGPVFNSIPVTRPPVAVLYSLSQLLHEQALNREINYGHQTAHGKNLVFVYLAGKLLQHQFLPVLDEDILDGTLSAHHQAIILTSLSYLDEPVRAALKRFAERGGLVLLTADCSVEIAGATRLGISPGWPDQRKIEDLAKAGKNREAADLQRLRQYLQGAHRLAAALQPQLEKAGIRPPITSSEPGIVVTRHAKGDIEYLLAVNAAHDPEGDAMLGIKPVNAVLAFARDPRPVYDAIHGGIVSDLAPGPHGVSAPFRFGPGQMRVFARTTRPIGGIRLGSPIVDLDLGRGEQPRRLELAASILDTNGRLLNVDAPLQVRVLEPSGNVRYDLFRGTESGSLRLHLPLAINDPPGKWTVSVRDLLANTEDSATFELRAASECSAAAGLVSRAVHWPADREHIFRFFREHRQVTIVKGTNAFNERAATRLQGILKPWTVDCLVSNALDVKVRSLSDDEAATWVGLDYASKGQIKTGGSNSPAVAGFAIPGGVILLGNPEDNPLIKFVAGQRLLAYQPMDGQMPGPSRGFVSWQLGGIGINQQSITLIAHDADGMAEAVGTVYEMQAGLEPLAPLIFPTLGQVQAAPPRTAPPQLAQLWSIVLSDRIDAVDTAGPLIVATTHAGEVVRLSQSGKIVTTRVLSPAEWTEGTTRDRTTPPVQPQVAGNAASGRLLKFSATSGAFQALAYWGGAVEVWAGDILRGSYRGFQDTTALAWAADRLVVGDADGVVKLFQIP